MEFSFEQQALFKKELLVDPNVISRIIDDECDYLAMMELIIDDQHVKLVDFLPKDFSSFPSSRHQYGYHLRSANLNGQNLHMLSVPVMLASKNPNTMINDPTLKGNVERRNDGFRAFFKANPDLLQFAPNSNELFPVIESTSTLKPEASASYQYPVTRRNFLRLG